MSTTGRPSHTSIVVRSAIYNVAFYVSIVVLMLLFLPVLLMPYRATLWLARLWGRVSLWLLAAICNTTVEFRGLEHIPTGPALIASKHQSFLETFSLLQHIPDFSYVLKRELTWIPFFGWLLMTAKQIGIDRRRGRSAMGQLLSQAEDFFKRGRSLILFPEGTRRPIGAMPAYKSGVSHVYAAGHAPCLPVALNTGLFWPRRSFMRFPGRCVIEFLPPIAPGLPREEFMTLLQSRIEQRTDALVAEARQESPWLADERVRERRAPARNAWRSTRSVSLLGSRWRWMAVVAVAVIVLPVLGWSAFWLYARLRAGAEMDAFLDTRSGLPVHLACGRRSIGGYPFDIALNCVEPVLTVAGDAGPVTLRFPRLSMTTRLTDPRDQTIDLEGPLAASDVRSSARAEWSSMSLGMRGEVSVADSVLLRGEGFALTCEGCPDVLRRTAAQGVEILAQRRGDTTDFTFSAALNGIRSEALSALTASDQPAVFTANGIITQFELPTSLRFAAETERWRRDGGEIVVEKSVLDQGALHAEIGGRFALDATHRPTAQFTVGARNAATLISAFTRSLNPLLQLAIGAALRGIDNATAKGGNDLSVQLPGTIENGALSIGPARGIATVQPLY